MAFDFGRELKDIEQRKSLIEGELASLRLRIVRAWKDPEYRKSLTPAELATLPPNPSGTAELTKEALKILSGGIADQPLPLTQVEIPSLCDPKRCSIWNFPYTII